MVYHIYKIYNIISEKVYIGQSQQPKIRFQQHFNYLRRNKHPNQHLQNAYNLYGENSFTFEIIFSKNCNENEIDTFEIEFINKYDSFNNGYNMTCGGQQHKPYFKFKLRQQDVLEIYSVLEFLPGSGQLLAKIFEVSEKTISRIKNRESYILYIKKYDELTENKKKEIFNKFVKDYNLLEIKYDNASNSQRKLSKEQVFKILSLKEFYPNNFYPTKLAKEFNITRSIIPNLLKDSKRYANFKNEYNSLNINKRKSYSGII